MPQAIEFAAPRLTNASGIINTLVVLREVPAETLRASGTELDPFFGKAKANGPQTAARVADVVKRRGE